MRRQFLTKKYWLRVAGNFLFLLVLYTIISYFFREDGESFWDLSFIQQRSGFAFFMAIVFAYRQQEQPGFNLQNGQDYVKLKWSVKEFFNVLLIMLVFAIIAMSILFGIGWLVKSMVSPSDEAVGKVYLKALAVTSIMTFLAVIALCILDRLGIRWDRRR